MELVYTHENLFLVNNALALLQREGIDAQVRNQYASGGRGELPVFETWPQLWVAQGAEAARARAVLDRWLQRGEGADWCCAHCGESNAASFETCWRCQRPSGESPSG